jgi:hypothetical protein
MRSNKSRSSWTLHSIRLCVVVARMRLQHDHTPTDQYNLTESLGDDVDGSIIAIPTLGTLRWSSTRDFLCNGLPWNGGCSLLVFVNQVVQLLELLWREPTFDQTSSQYSIAQLDQCALKYLSSFRRHPVYGLFCICPCKHVHGGSTSHR